MALRRKLVRLKKHILSNIRYLLRNSVTLEKLAAIFVIVCVIFILTCNYVLQAPVKLKSADFTEINIRAGSLRLPMNDPRIINHITKLFLRSRPPSRNIEDLKALSERYMNTETSKITDYVLKLTKNQTDGFFVEYPAKDGLLNSQTILLEKLYNWTGLLIEHDPKYLSPLKEKGRYCWISTACLSVHQYPELEKKRSPPISHIRNKTDNSLKFDKRHESTFFAQCFPLYSILLTLDVNSIDLLSLRLDDPATGLAILKTLPFNFSIYIKVIVIDVESNSREYRKIFQFVTAQGYIMFRHLKGNTEEDKSRQVFVHQFQFKPES